MTANYSCALFIIITAFISYSLVTYGREQYADFFHEKADIYSRKDTSAQHHLHGDQLVASAVRSVAELQGFNFSDNTTLLRGRRLVGYVAADFTSKLANMRKKSAKTVLVHMHIPKAGGTAISLTLSSSCQCKEVECERQCPPVQCDSCPQVQGRDGYKAPYTMSRVTGWSCGVHSPLAVMRRAPCKPDGWTFADKDIFAVQIVMVREPFERFVSECVHWNNDGVSADWSAPLQTRKNKKNLVPYVLEIAKLPSTLLVHNRQVRMIGGTAANFNMDFNPKQGKLGSRWVPQSGGINDVYHRAIDTIGPKTPDVLISIHDQFGEFVCMLEVLYGDLYKFRWDSHASTHGDKKYQGAVDEYAVYRDNPSLYRAWLDKNELESAFYKEAKEIFNRQFQASLRLLKGYGEEYLKYTPHCKPFLSA